MSAVLLTIKPGVTLKPGVGVKVPVYVPPPPILKSLSFNGTQGTQLDILGTTTDWALGNQGTIEWWQKAPATNSLPGGWNGGILSQGTGQGNDGGMDVFQAAGFNTHFGNNTGTWPDPTADVWVHIAVVLVPANSQGANAHVYYNGLQQSLIGGYADSRAINGNDILHIGCRIPGVPYQNWTGLLANLHVNTQTLYTSNFTPVIRHSPIAGTVLLLDSTNPLVDLSASAHTTSGNVTVVLDGPV
jgi:hypothetical protein